MKIKNEANQTITIDNITFEANANGVMDVPDHLAKRLIETFSFIEVSEVKEKKTKKSKED